MTQKNTSIDLTKINKTLVIMLGGIGNFVLLIPALKALRESLEKKNITLLIAEPAIAEIAKSQNLVDDIILHDRRVPQNLATKYNFILDLRKRRFDLAFVASHTNALKGSLLTSFLGIPHRVGQNIKGRGFLYSIRVPFKKDTHETEGALEMVRSLGVHIDEMDPSMKVFTIDEDVVKVFLKKRGFKKDKLLVGMHAGSGPRQVYKRWRKERFAQLADHLIDKYQAQVVFTGSEHEFPLNEEINRLMKNEAVNTAGQFSLSQTAALLKKCDLIISNDSGIAHIGAAVQTALIVLFGPTEIQRIMPRGEDVHIIQKKLDETPGDTRDISLMDLIPVEEVFEKAQALLGKRKNEA